ncbi:MAG: hypothetical protein ABL958_14990 [Bdellovibrionia bacterium]
MQNCPRCGFEIKSDFGMVNCPSCGELVLLDDGSDDLGEAAPKKQKSGIKTVKQETAPVVGSEDIDLSEEEFEPEPPPAPTPPAPSRAARPPQPPPIQVPQSVFEPEAEAEPEFEIQPDIQGDDDFAPVTPEQPTRQPGDDLGEIADYGNSEVSQANDGLLMFDVIIEGIDTNELRSAVRDILSDRRFLWNGDSLIAGVKNGALRISKVNSIKASILVRRLKHLDIRIRWQQYAIIQMAGD